MKDAGATLPTPIKRSKEIMNPNKGKPLLSFLIFLLIKIDLVLAFLFIFLALTSTGGGGKVIFPETGGSGVELL